MSDIIEVKMRTHINNDIKILAEHVAERIMQGKRPKEITNSIKTLQLSSWSSQQVEQLADYMHYACLAYFDEYYQYPTQRTFFIDELQFELRRVGQKLGIVMDGDLEILASSTIVQKVENKKVEVEEESNEQDSMGDINKSNSIMLESNSIIETPASIQQSILLKSNTEQVEYLENVLTQSNEQEKIRNSIIGLARVYERPERSLQNFDMLSTEIKDTVSHVIRSFLWEMTTALPKAVSKYPHRNPQYDNVKELLPQSAIGQSNTNNIPTSLWEVSRGQLWEQCKVWWAKVQVSNAAEQNSYALSETAQQSSANIAPPSTTPSNVAEYMDRTKSKTSSFCNIL